MTIERRIPQDAERLAILLSVEASKSADNASPQVLPCLFRLYGVEMAVASLWYMVQMTATLCTPITVHLLLEWLSSSDGTGNGSFGYGLAAFLCFACAASFLAIDRYQEKAQSAGIAARGALCALMYRTIVAPKSFPLHEPPFAPRSLSEGDHHTTADIVAAAVGDMEAVLVHSEALVHLFEARIALLLQPLEIIGVLLLLVAVTGAPAALGAIGVALSGVGIAAVCEKRMEVADTQLGSIAARRGKVLWGTISSMRGVKLNGWEFRFGKRIERLRRMEAPVAIKRGLLFAISCVATNEMIDVISLVVVLIYTRGPAVSQFGGVVNGKFLLGALGGIGETADDDDIDDDTDYKEDDNDGAQNRGNMLTATICFTYWVSLGILHGKIFSYPLNNAKLASATSCCSAFDELWRRFSRGEGHSNRCFDAAEKLREVPGIGYASSSKENRAGVSISLEHALISWCRDSGGSCQSSGGISGVGKEVISSAQKQIALGDNMSNKLNQTI